MSNLEIFKQLQLTFSQIETPIDDNRLWIAFSNLHRELTLLLLGAKRDY